MAVDLPPQMEPAVPWHSAPQVVTESASALERQWADLWDQAETPSVTPGAALAGTRVHRLPDHPHLWIIDFPDLVVQAAALNRVSALIERRDAPKDRIASETEMTELVARGGHGNAGRYLLGHDYRLAAVAWFYTLAQRDGVALNPAEQDLRGLLQDLGLLEQPAPGQWRATRPELAIVTIAGASDTPTARHLSPFERIAILRHEISHGEYFTNTHYRQYCWAFWEARSPEEQAAITTGLGQLGYDPSDPELLVNELQAFLWEPEAGAWIDLGLRKAGRSLAALRASFLDGLDRAAIPVSPLLATGMMRRVSVAPPGDWGAALRDWSITKVSEEMP